MNKKVLGAESIEINGIKFRSRLEANIYKKVLLPSGLDIRPEPFKLILQESLKPTKIVYNGMKKVTAKQRATTYLPDFVYFKDDKPVALIEVKGGYVTDRWPLKKQMTLRVLEVHESLLAFFEVHNLREAQFCIDMLKGLL